MAASVFILNRELVEEHGEPGLAMLDAIRQRRRLTGCKDVCREGDCGACLVLLGRLQGGRVVYQAVASCLLPLGAVAGCHLLTIEGLNAEQLTPIQQALVDQGAIQCGFCTPGIVVALTGFFLNSPDSDVEAAVDALAGNLCRCTGYSGIKRAIKQLCGQFDLAGSPLTTRLQDCIHWGLVPGYLAEMADRLSALPKPVAVVPDDQAVVVAGGTDLWAQRPDRLTRHALNFLPAADSLHCVVLERERCRIDAATTMAQLHDSPVMRRLLPSLGKDLQLLGSAPIRQRATLGGNLANASPIGDLSVMFLALDAQLRLVDNGRQRQLRLRDFFLAYKQTACQPGERLLEISFHYPPQTLFSFEKVSKRRHLDIASVNSAASIRVDDGLIKTIHLAAGGVAPIPCYLSETCEFLTGKPLRADIISQAAEIAQREIEPIGDLRGSVEYKRLLLRQLIFAHFLKLFPEQLDWEALHANG